MKKTKIKRQADIGSSIELSNAEELVIANKWRELFPLLNNRKITNDTLVKLEIFNRFMETKIIDGVISLEQIEQSIFPETDEDINLERVAKASVAGYIDLEDEERAHRKFEDQ